LQNENFAGYNFTAHVSASKGNTDQVYCEDDKKGEALMRLLITGGAGLVGSHTAEFFAKDQKNEVIVWIT
jgi:hypothetical protein